MSSVSDRNPTSTPPASPSQSSLDRQLPLPIQTLALGNPHRDSFDVHPDSNSNPDASSDSGLQLRPNLNVNINAAVDATQNAPVYVVSPTQTQTPPRNNSSSSLISETQTEEHSSLSSATISTSSSYSNNNAKAMNVMNAMNRNSKIHPYSHLSPRVPDSYNIERVQSSPCVLDASPKISQRKGLATHVPSQLTPVTRNTNRYDTAFFGTDSTAKNSLSVPEEHSFTKISYDAESQGKNVNQIIRPRSISCVPNHNKNNNNNNSDDIAALRPSSPPTTPSLRPPTATATLSSSTTATATTSTMVDSSKETFSNPLDASVKLDRTHYSVPIISTASTTNTRSNSNHRNVSNSSHLSSPESTNETPEPRSPRSPVDSSHLHIPYQPTRDSSLASFGVATDELDDIFLPLRTSNRFRRSSKDKVVLVNGGRGGSGAIGIGINRSAAFGYNMNNLDDEDASTHISDSQSSVSIPSIRLSARIRSSTQDSYNTFEGYEDEEDNNFSLSTLDDEEEDLSAYFTNHEGMQFRSHQNTDGVPSSNTRRKKNQRGGSGSKCLSSRKEKQVYEWLRTLEVDKDNNEYVAEAASSKFLTGKLKHEECVLDAEGKRLYLPEKTRGVQERQHLGRLGAFDNIQPTLIESSDSLELEFGKSKDSKKTSTSPSRISVKSSSSSTVPVNKIVMGRNICAFERNKIGKTKSSMKGSGFYR